MKYGNILKMLDVGESCELKTVKESYINMMNHWDAFFDEATAMSEMRQFIKDLLELELVYLKEHNLFDFYVTSIEVARDKIRSANG